MGLGLSLTIATTKHGSYTLGHEEATSVFLLFGTLLGSLVFGLISISLDKFRIR